MHFTFSSKSSPGKDYRTDWDDTGDGRLSCDCKGWTTKREGQPRNCIHTKHVALQFTASHATAVEGDYLYLRPRRGVNITATVAVPAVTAAPLAHYPMLATASASPLSGPAFAAHYARDWAMEEKFDGHRLVVVRDGHGVTGYARPQAGKIGGNVRPLPPAVTAALMQFPAGVYDGELVNPGGRSSDVVAIGAALCFVVFDLLVVEGASWMDRGYDYRHAGLAEICRQRASAAVRLSPTLPVEWAEVERIWARGGEGVILKRRASRYQPGVRSADWVKVKTAHEAVLTVAGFEEGKQGPFSTLRLVGPDKKETTVKTRTAALIRDIAARPESFVGRALVITFQERLPSGSYRHPMFGHWADADEVAALESSLLLGEG